MQTSSETTHTIKGIKPKSGLVLNLIYLILIFEFQALRPHVLLHHQTAHSSFLPCRLKSKNVNGLLKNLLVFGGGET